MMGTSEKNKQKATRTGGGTSSEGVELGASIIRQGIFLCAHVDVGYSIDQQVR